MEPTVFQGLSPTEVFESLGGGTVAHDLHLRLMSLGQRVLETRNSGTLTLKLKVDPVKGHDAAFSVTEEISVREPKQEPHGAVFITIGDGQLHKSDPRQTTMFETRIVESGPSELRVIENKPAIVREVS